MNSHRYVEFLRAYFMPYYNHLSARIRAKTIFMQDNATSHASAYTRSFLEEEGISGKRYMEWPPQSTDINPIENYWSAFKALMIYNGIANCVEMRHFECNGIYFTRTVLHSTE